MGFWDVAKDVALTVGTGGAYGAYKAGNAATNGGVGRVLFGSQGDPNRNRYQDQDYIRSTVQQGILGAQGRPAPQMGGTQLGGQTMVDQAQQAQFRQREIDLANNLQRVMGGQQAGAGELAVNRQTGNAMNQAIGAATMGRGNNAAGSARSAARAASSIGLGGAGMAAQAQMSDQQQAGQLLSSVLGQGRAADINIASQDAAAGNTRSLQQGQMDQMMAIENLRAQLAAQGMSDAAINNYLTQLGNMNAAEAGMRSQDNGIIGPLISTGGQAAAMAASDERVKTNVTDAAAEIDTALSALSARRFDYKDPDKHGKGSRVGIMAQDLLKTPAGKTLVADVGGVLSVDLSKAPTFALAGLGRLAERISKVESRK